MNWFLVRALAALVRFSSCVGVSHPPPPPDDTLRCGRITYPVVVFGIVDHTHPDIAVMIVATFVVPLYAVTVPT